MFLAAFLADRAKRLNEFAVPLGAIALAAGPILLVFVQPDIGTALVYTSVVAAVLFVSGVRWLHLALIGSAALIAVLAVLWWLPAAGVNVLKPYQADRLTGGTLPVAGRFEVHEMAMDGGVMKMRELKKGLEIKPGETVELKPGGFHLMFMDLKQGLKEGESYKGTLVFEKAGKIEVEYKIGPIGGGAPAAGGGHSHH